MSPWNDIRNTLGTWYLGEYACWNRANVSWTPFMKPFRYGAILCYRQNPPKPRVIVSGQWCWSRLRRFHPKLLQDMLAETRLMQYYHSSVLFERCTQGISQLTEISRPEYWTRLYFYLSHGQCCGTKYKQVIVVNQNNHRKRSGFQLETILIVRQLFVTKLL